jgi:Rrf2 family protein
MIFTTKAEYGVRLLVELGRARAEGGPAAPVSLKAIAEAEGLPLAYLERIVALLKKAGIVESTRGAHGGYRLARASSAISAASIIDAIEGPVAITECSGNHSACDIESVCRTGSAWQRINGAIRRALEEITLAQLCGQEAVAVWRPELWSAGRPAPAMRPTGRT